MHPATFPTPNHHALAMQDSDLAPTPSTCPPLAASMTPLDAKTCEQITGGYRYASRDRPRAYHATQYHYTYYRIANPAYLLG